MTNNEYLSFSSEDRETRNSLTVLFFFLFKNGLMVSNIFQADVHLLPRLRELRIGKKRIVFQFYVMFRS